MSDNDSANFPPLVSREQAGNDIGDALRLFVGRGRRYSVKQLSNATGVPDRTIESAMAAGYEHRPVPDWALLSLMKFLGPEFSNEFLGLAGQVAADPIPLDHDTLCDLASDYVRSKLDAHHPASPEGVNIAACEKQSLDRQVTQLRVVGG